MVEWLITNGASLKSVDQRGLTPIHHAAAAGHANLFDYFQRIGADLDQRAYAKEGGYGTMDGMRPIDIAAANDRATVIKKLIDWGIPIELKDDNPNTYDSPIFWAAWFGREKSIDVLLEEDARIDIKDILGRTPFDVASKNGHKQIADQLGKVSEVGPSKALNKQLYDAVIMAMVHQKPKIIDNLISDGADVNYVDEKTGESVLARAVMLACSFAGKISGPSNAVNVRAGQLVTEMVDKLLREGADPNIHMMSGEPAIMYVAKFGNGEILKLLIDSGADMTVKDKMGNTVIDAALQFGNKECVAVLREHEQ